MSDYRVIGCDHCGKIVEVSAVLPPPDRQRRLRVWMHITFWAEGAPEAEPAVRDFCGWDCLMAVGQRAKDDLAREREKMRLPA